MKQRKVCARCKRMFAEAWPNGVTALRCGAGKPYPGRVTETYPRGCSAFVSERPAPAWCTDFKEKRRSRQC